MNGVRYTSFYARLPMNYSHTKPFNLGKGYGPTRFEPKILLPASGRQEVQVYERVESSEEKRTPQQ